MKITTISDTHGFEPNLPGGDLLIHAGDLTKYGFRSEVVKQLNYLHEQLDKYKDILVIPGNHDLFSERHLDQFREACMLGGLVTLINEGTVIQGLKIWGSPVTPKYHDWAFNRNQNELYDIWQNIPSNLDFLVTHGPPRDILDLNSQGVNIGCVELAQRIKQLTIPVHMFGHCHESRGKLVHNGTNFLNAAQAVINFKYDPATKLVTGLEFSNP